MGVQPSNLLRFLSILLNNKFAPAILQSLGDAQKSSSTRRRSDEIRKAIGISENKKGLFSETLSKLEAANLILGKNTMGQSFSRLLPTGLRHSENTND